MSFGSQVECPLPKRVSVHGNLQEYSAFESHARAVGGVKRARTRSRSAMKWSGVTVTAGMLAAVLTTPMASAAPADNEENKNGKISGRFGVEESWAETSGKTAPSADDLVKQPGAASRAKYRLSLEVGHCVPVEAAADGSRQMTTQQVFYMPLQEGTFTFTSPFGFRIHPIVGSYLLHRGDDYAAALGTPIYSVGDGVVKTATWGTTEGFYVVIEHVKRDGTKFTSWYLHQYPEDVLVTEGQTVKAGQQIGAVGNSGRSTGPHLHFEIHDEADTPLVPSQWLEENAAIYLGEDCK